MKLPGLSCILLLLALAACKNAAPPYMQLEGQAQGTTFLIQYRDSLHRDFSSSIDSLFRVIDHSMSLWDSTSLISRFNQNDPGVVLDTHFLRVFDVAQGISSKTHGAFDVTVGPLVRAWGFSAKRNEGMPDSSTVDSLRECIGYEKISRLNGSLQKAKPCMQLDFNAIAQGYTVDLMANWLMDQGIRDYLVEIGGEVRAQGKNERGTDWNIGIDKPVQEKDGERPLQVTIPLRNQSLATSGSYRKFHEKGGRKLSHVIDPSTGYPVQHKMISVSVLAADCTTADAYATAFLVMGMENALQLADAMGMEIYCIYLNQNGELETKATSRFPE